MRNLRMLLKHIRIPRSKIMTTTMTRPIMMTMLQRRRSVKLSVRQPKWRRKVSRRRVMARGLLKLLCGRSKSLLMQTTRDSKSGVKGAVERVPRVALAEEDRRPMGRFLMTSSVFVAWGSGIG